MRRSDARHLTAAFRRNATESRALTARKPNEEIPNEKQISIALAAGLLIVGASVASATEMSRPLSSKPSSKAQDYTYSQQQNMKAQQHAAVRAPWHNAD